MYNDIIIIAVCVFAVYGAYMAFRELAHLFAKSRVLYIAIMFDNGKDESDIADAISTAECEAGNGKLFLPRPILLCKKEDAEAAKKYGYDVYVKSGR